MQNKKKKYVLVDHHLSVMCLCVKDQFPVNLSTMLTFSEADLPAVNLFICCFIWQVLGVLFVWLML